GGPFSKPQKGIIPQIFPSLLLFDPVALWARGISPIKGNRLDWESPFSMVWQHAQRCAAIRP
ncbi:hypothetical protein J6590_057299, partial [Homalodisca vitripennis]